MEKGELYFKNISKFSTDYEIHNIEVITLATMPKSVSKVRDW